MGFAAVGLVDVAALPSPSTATQSDADGHERPLTPPLMPGFALVSPWPAVQLGVAEFASVERSAVPAAVMPTQVESEMHDIAAMLCDPLAGAFVTSQLEAEPVGLVELRILPIESPAAHSEAEGHERLAKFCGEPLGAELSATTGADHDNDDATAGEARTPNASTDNDTTSAYAERGLHDPIRGTLFPRARPSSTCCRLIARPPIRVVRATAMLPRPIFPAPAG